MRFPNRRGIALVAAIMLMVFATIAVFGVVTFITERLRQLPIEETFLKAIYLARAGVDNAVYYFRFRDLTGNGYFSLGQTNIDANNFFVLGGTAANLLMVDTFGSVVQSSNRSVAIWPMHNATDSETITITTMTVSWSGIPANRRLKEIWLGNTPTLVWSGSGTSGSVFNIADFTLDLAPAIYTANRLLFSHSIKNGVVTVTFNMTDGSSRSLTLYPASNNYNFTINSMGKTVGSNIYRTITADYNARTGQITNYAEINAPVP